MAFYNRARLTIAVLAAMATVLAGRHGHTSPVPEKLLPLLQHRDGIARELAAPVRACVARRDTGHAAFHGCIDWHSSVHGVWALVAYTRATGDKRYEPVIAEALTATKIEAERELLRSRRGFEMPYGRAWFLRLAIDHRRYYGTQTLKAMADEVLESLMNHFRRSGIDPASKEYDSASWALINMYDYARLAGNQSALGAVRGWIIDKFAYQGAVCDPSQERGTFMAVCTNWAWLASRVLERERFQAWLDVFFGAHGLPRPISGPINWHHHGLNFSRAWGLWEIYSATGELKYVDAYVAHFRQGYDDPQKWRGSYEGVGHWVPQFGIFALQGLFGNRGRK